MKDSGKDLVLLSAEDTRLQNVVDALRGNTFGILSYEGTIDDKVVRLLNLLPMAFQVVDEARDTIVRLRDAVDKASKNVG